MPESQASMDNKWLSSETVARGPRGKYMAVLTSRSRLVTFRLSADEYKELQSVCIAEAARSISDFARSAVLRRMVQAGKRVTLSEDLATLSAMLEELDTSLRDLRGRIARILGTGKESIKVEDRQSNSDERFDASAGAKER